MTSAHHSHRNFRKTLYALLAAFCAPITSLSLQLQPLPGCGNDSERHCNNGRIDHGQKKPRTNFRPFLTEVQHVQRTMTRQRRLTHLLLMQEGMLEQAARRMLLLGLIVIYVRTSPLFSLCLSFSPLALFLSLSLHKSLASLFTALSLLPFSVSSFPSFSSGLKWHWQSQ